MTFFWQNPLLHGLPLPGRSGYVYTVAKDTLNRYFLISSGTNFDKPEVFYSWFPIWTSECHGDVFVGEELEEGGRYGNLFEYVLKNNRRCRLTIRGDVEPVKVEHAGAPRPKVRKGIEVRWRDGHWQKLLKRGWVPA